MFLFSARWRCCRNSRYAGYTCNAPISPCLLTAFLGECPLSTWCEWSLCWIVQSRFFAALTSPCPAQELTLRAWPGGRGTGLLYWANDVAELLSALCSSCLTALTLDNVEFASDGKLCSHASLRNLEHLSLDYMSSESLEGLAALTDLTHLEVHVSDDEALSVPIGRLPRLRHLDSLNADIDVSWLAGLTYLSLWGRGAAGLNLALLPHLQHLRLGNCGMEVVPEGISGLQQLTTLELEGNDALAGLQELVLPPRLLSLDLSNCSLPALPPAVATNSVLVGLYLGGNIGMLWPAELRLHALEQLELSSWGLMQVPPALSMLSALSYLHLGGSQDMVFFPAMLAPLRHLAVLNIGLAGLTEGMSALQALTSLKLGMYKPVGMGSLFGMSRLQRLSLQSHAAEIHELPDEIDELPEGLGALTWLALGPVAHDAAGSLASLSSLRELELKDAKALPAGVMALAHLTKLRLAASYGTRFASGEWPAADRVWLEENFGWEEGLSCSPGTVVFYRID
jgi:Leucine-rich repeat (LRR) protein